MSGASSDSLAPSPPPTTSFRPKSTDIGKFVYVSRPVGVGRGHAIRNAVEHRVEPALPALFERLANPLLQRLGLAAG